MFMNLSSIVLSLGIPRNINMVAIIARQHDICQRKIDIFDFNKINVLSFIKIIKHFHVLYCIAMEVMLYLYSISLALYWV